MHREPSYLCIWYTQLAMFFMNSGLSPEYVTRTGVVDMAPVVVTKDNVDTILPADRW